MPKDRPTPKADSDFGAENETPFQKFQRLTEKILQVPKEAIRKPKKDEPCP